MRLRRGRCGNINSDFARQQPSAEGLHTNRLRRDGEANIPNGRVVQRLAHVDQGQLRTEVIAAKTAQGISVEVFVLLGVTALEVKETLLVRRRRTGAV